jgi:thiol-disulfide isomerase/thioredoxin
MTETPGPEGKPVHNDPPHDGTRRTWVLIAVAFCVFWAFYLTLFGPRPRAPKLELSGNGERASYDWTILDLADRPVSFAQFKGKPVFLNIWATWCGPCVQEMPSIARLADEPRLKDKGIAFVCVSTDESSVEVRRFLEGRSWHMSFFRTEQVPSAFYTDGIPATFIIAADGRIAAAEVGSAQWDRPEVVAILEKLAGEASKAP